MSAFTTISHLVSSKLPTDYAFRSQISEAAVVGVASEQWGQKVAAIVVLRPDQANTGRGGKAWGVMDLRRALKDKLANYKIPQELKVVDAIPKNAMGKSMPIPADFRFDEALNTNTVIVNKKSLVNEVFGPDA